MLFRFSISKVNMVDSIYDQRFVSERAAKVYARYLLRTFEENISVTIHRYLTNDSCGPIRFIGTYILEDGQVINRETKLAL